MSSKSFALVFFMLGALLPCFACESSRGCPPSEPIYKWKEIPAPYPVVLKFGQLPPLELPEWPAFPGHDADEEEWKAWSLEVKRVHEEREALLEARIKAFEEREAALLAIEDTYEIPETDPPD